MDVLDEDLVQAAVVASTIMLPLRMFCCAGVASFPEESCSGSGCILPVSRSLEMSRRDSSWGDALSCSRASADVPRAADLAALENCLKIVDHCAGCLYNTSHNRACNRREFPLCASLDRTICA